MKESIAKRLQCNIEPYSLCLNGIGGGGLKVFGKITVPVRFEDVHVELDIFVVKDKDFNYDLLIGRNAVEHSDLEIVTDTKGSKIRRKQFDKVGLCINSIQTKNSYEAQIDSLKSKIGPRFTTKNY